MTLPPLLAFDDVAAAVAGVPYMSAREGRIIYDHVKSTGARRVLELGSAHGVGTAYMAAALPAGGELITVDRLGSAYDPAPEDVLSKAGVRDRVTIDRQFSTYTWWLKGAIERGERFDFVYLDGAKNWTIDGLAVLLIEKVLNPGGWLLMDDLGWTYASKPWRNASDGVALPELSDDERNLPHLRAVFDLLIQPHPAFTELRIQDDWWGWARKRTDADDGAKTLHIETTRSLKDLAMTAALKTARSAKARMRVR